MKWVGRWRFNQLLVVALAQVAMGGCDEPVGPVLEPGRLIIERPEIDAQLISATHDPSLAPVLPATPGEHSPSFAQFYGDIDVFTDVQMCAGCHAEQFEQWSDSPHHHASFSNPYYRVAADGFIEENDIEAFQHCAGCHDLALLFSEGENLPGAPDDPRSYLGVTCLSCHAATNILVDGNGSYTVDTRGLVFPADEYDTAVVAEHRGQMDDANASCISCHRVFLSGATGNDQVLVGIDEPTHHARSAFAGDGVGRIDELIPAQDCVSCHMPAGASHRFPGSHTALASLVGEQQLQAVRARLEGAVDVFVPAMRIDGGEWAPIALGDAASSPESEIEVAVVVHNAAAGHLFPGGTGDLQNTWMHVRAYCGERVCAESGGGESADDGYVFTATLVDEEANVIDNHLVSSFRLPVWDHHLASRDVQVLVYRLPAGLAVDRIEAEVLHRRHTESFNEQACAGSVDERGTAFRAGGVDLNACEALVLTRVAAGESVAAGSSDWRTWWLLGMGLLRGVQEHQTQTTSALEFASARLAEVSVGMDAESSGRASAMISLTLAQAYGRIGRTDDALQVLGSVESLLPGHPAVPYTRGTALMWVWRFDEAVTALELALERAPGNDEVLRTLATAYGSAGQASRALETAQAGLQLLPRDPSFLRSQTLALDVLARADNTPEGSRAIAEIAAEARAAFLEHRPYELGQDIVSRCIAETAGCSVGRDPVPVLNMRAP